MALTKIVFDCSTGIQTVVDLTAEEIAASEKSAANNLVKAAAREKEETAKATAKASGDAKLKALGLTDAEIAVLVG
jgi:hypothetical protein|tara:strand:+ start:646 stop:873 length:228 start_codon:yes stop_codon:yes gene_type:complete